MVLTAITMNKQSNAVNTWAEVEQLGQFAIKWANAQVDPEGETVKDWIEGREEIQTQLLDWGDSFFEWKPKEFPKHEQQRIQRWLRAVNKGPIPKGLRTELDELVEQISGSYAVKWFDGQGPMKITHMTGSPLALAALGVTALASSELRERFGQCEYCSRYFLDVGVRRGPRGRRYCPDRTCGTAARVSRHYKRSGKLGGL